MSGMAEYKDGGDWKIMRIPFKKENTMSLGGDTFIRGGFWQRRANR